MIELSHHLPRLLILIALVVVGGLFITLGIVVTQPTAPGAEGRISVELDATKGAMADDVEPRWGDVVYVPETEEGVVEKYGRAQWSCDGTDEAGDELEGEALLDNLLEVAARARKAERLDEAARCIREAGYVATNSPMASRVLLHAADLLPQLGEEALEILMGYEAFEPEAESGCASRFCGAEVRGILTCSPQPSSINAVRQAPSGSEERRQARRELQVELRDKFYEHALKLMPSRQAAQAVIDHEIIAPKSVHQRVVPTIHRAGSTARFGSIDEAKEDLEQTLRRRADSRREGLCENVKPAEDGSIESCYDYDVLHAGKAQVNGGRFELFDAQFNQVFDSLACRENAGTAHLAFYDETTGAVTRVRLPGSIPSSQSCGSGGWGHHRYVEIVERHPEAKAVQISLGGGSVLSKQGCGLDDNLPSGMRGKNLWCQADEEGEIHCIGQSFSQTSHDTQDQMRAYREVTLPAFDFDNSGRLIPDYTHVDESVWRPIEPWLTRPVSDVLQAREKIRNQVREAF